MTAKKSQSFFTDSEMSSVTDFADSYSQFCASLFEEMTGSEYTADLPVISFQKFSALKRTFGRYAMTGIADIKAEIEKSGIKCLIQFSEALSFSLVSRLTGGSGSCRAPQRNLTDTETSVLSVVIRKMISEMDSLAEKYSKIKPVLVKTETTVERISLFSENEMTVTASFCVRTEKTESMITMTVSCEDLRELFAHFKQKSDEHSDYRESLLKAAGSITADITAVISGTVIDVSDVISLQAGDIIPLDSLIDQKAEIKVNGVPCFSAVPGLCGNKKAVRITDVFSESEGGLNND